MPQSLEACSRFSLPHKPAASADSSTAATALADKKKSEEYSEVMSERMGATLTYRHERGLDFNRILPDLIVGSCLQTPADVDRLAEQEGVTTVFCLQEDCDMEWFNLDIGAIVSRRCFSGRRMDQHLGMPVRDFDPFDLRLKLPKVIARLTKEHDPAAGGTIYIHCTAGMGRAPGAALAYMNWFRKFQLDEGYKLVTGLRRCSPKVEAIRASTVDLLCGVAPVPVTIGVSRRGTAQQVQLAHHPTQTRPHTPSAAALRLRLPPGDGPHAITRCVPWTPPPARPATHTPTRPLSPSPPPLTQIAGLDVGWNQRLDLQVAPHASGSHRFELKRSLLPGRYQYKFITDGVWSASADHPTMRDGDNTNNYVEVMGKDLNPEQASAQMRLLSHGGDLTADERAQIAQMLCPWETHA
ncbi:MAG: hypothetical protein WDW38_000548 [Sanguina aurantia]